MSKYSPGYVPGDRLVDCAICGFTWRRSAMKIGISGNQIGLEVCPDDYDPEHPLDNKLPIRKNEGPIQVK